MRRFEARAPLLGVEEVMISFETDRLELGTQWSDALQYNPRAMLFVLARYNFAAKVIRQVPSILELGCSEGIGVPTLGQYIDTYEGVDQDAEAIEEARRNWSSGHVKFTVDDFLGKTYGKFDAAISLDVIEHIPESSEVSYFATIHENLKDGGIAVVGTPNISAQQYQSEPSRVAHINLYSAERLKAAMSKAFQNVFIFELNDEVTHTGFYPMGHYLMAVGANRRASLVD